jgi:hypothetical protein
MILASYIFHIIYRACSVFDFSLNGLDSWWIECHIVGVTGWSIEHYGNDD